MKQFLPCFTVIPFSHSLYLDAKNEENQLGINEWEQMPP